MSTQQTRSLESEEALKVLREIKNNPDLTQRQLSSRIGISLGKVNFLIKAMIDRGLVKASLFKNSKNKNAYLYYLTPQGMEVKAKTTFNFLKRKIEEYEKLHQEIQDLKKEALDLKAQLDTHQESRL